MILRPSDADFFVRLGEAAQAVGHAGFHTTLLRLLGTLIMHDSAWIIRYSPNLAPEVLHTTGVSSHVIDWYCETYSAFDPFARTWRGSPRPGVMTLGQALTPSPESDIYVMVFQIKAGFADELALMLPIPGGSCLALFLQRSRTRFSAEEAAVAQLVFPTMDGLHDAHVSRLLLELKSLADHPGFHPELPSMIVDRSGRELHANRRWREASRRLHGLDALTALPVQEGQRRVVGKAGERLRVENLGADFPLAPGGRMYVLDETPEPPDAEAVAAQALASTPLPPITPRERDILALMLQGRTTGEIAQRLSIGKGTIKNYRLRIYRKAKVSSERALLALFMPLLSGQSGSGAGAGMPCAGARERSAQGYGLGP